MQLTANDSDDVNISTSINIGSHKDNNGSYWEGFVVGILFMLGLCTFCFAGYYAYNRYTCCESSENENEEEGVIAEQQIEMDVFNRGKEEADEGNNVRTGDPRKAETGIGIDEAEFMFKLQENEKEKTPPPPKPPEPNLELFVMKLDKEKLGGFAKNEEDIMADIIKEKDDKNDNDMKDDNDQSYSAKNVNFFQTNEAQDVALPEQDLALPENDKSTDNVNSFKN
jgi:hypothetical protein